MGQPKTVYLKEYAPAPFVINSCELLFEIEASHTTVTNRMHIEQRDSTQSSLFLDGEGLVLEQIVRDGVPLDPTDYTLSEAGLTIHSMPASSVIEIVTTIYPDQNTALEGLYRSGEILCTQNEPEGFRRITYFIDRPDNMATFTTTIRADKTRYPILLSNGNPAGNSLLADGRHEAIWIDPHPKPPICLR